MKQLTRFHVTQRIMWSLHITEVLAVFQVIKKLTTQWYININNYQQHTHTRLTVSRYLKGKTNLDFTEARDSEWQWHQLGHMQVCISLQTDNHNNTPPLSFLQAGCPSCHPTNSIKALNRCTLTYFLCQILSKYPYI